MGVESSVQGVRLGQWSYSAWTDPPSLAPRLGLLISGMCLLSSYCIPGPAKTARGTTNKAQIQDPPSPQGVPAQETCATKEQERLCSQQGTRESGEPPATSRKEGRVTFQGEVAQRAGQGGRGNSLGGLSCESC